MNTQIHKKFQQYKKILLTGSMLAVFIAASSFVFSQFSHNTTGVVVRNVEVIKAQKQSATEKNTRSIARQRAIKRAQAITKQRQANRMVPAQTIENTSLHSAADDFPAPGNVIHPVVRIPNWGAMYTPSEWDRTYDQMPNSVFVAVPEYNIDELVIPLNTLMQNREANIDKITAKLYYSTRHFGQYDLDSGEYEWKHAGIDLKLPEGTPFGSIAGGKVFETGTESVMGNYVIIEHHIDNEIYYSIYGHMKTIDVQKDQIVRSGEQIGTVGSTGASSGAHIHLQINIRNPYWRSTESLTKEEAAKYTIHPIEFIEKY